MTGLPLSPWRVHIATIRAIVAETPGVWTFGLSLDDPSVKYSFQAGQFNMLYLPGIGESAISVSSDPEEVGKLQHTVRAVGNVTRAMAKLQPGSQIGVRGPFGTSWPFESFRGKDVILVAGGLGLAPLRPVVYSLIRHRRDFGRVTLIYGVRSPADLLFSSEYESWRKGGIDVQTTVNVASLDWQGAIGSVTPLLAPLPIEPARTGLFTCGPEVMMRFVAAGAVQRGVPTGQVFVSLERNMNCAVGLCGHCQFGPEFVCRDGPIFPFDRVRRLMLVENF